ncbi:MAG TPA: TIGR03936 family radical SAM-associated protein [Acidimicrobiia bacterium]|nr:TIGR03936 family radical SAM-associated protein [Acidimicrobiia bacterium]
MRGDAGFPVRLRFTKRGKVRFISHRDVARAFERAFRVQQLPLAFTQGFVPRPKVSFGLAVSVGHESDAEYLDVQLAEEVSLDALAGAVSGALPDGIDVTGAAALADRAPALQESVTGLAYRVTVTGPDDARVEPDDLRVAVGDALARPALPVTRTRKGHQATEDLRSIVRTMAVTDADDLGPVLDLELSTQPRSARPAEVLSAVGGDLVDRRVLRTKQWIERGGARLEPLEADARSRVPKGARVMREEGTHVRQHPDGGPPGLRGRPRELGAGRRRREPDRVDEANIR